MRDGDPAEVLKQFSRHNGPGIWSTNNTKSTHAAILMLVIAVLTLPCLNDTECLNAYCITLSTLLAC